MTLAMHQVPAALGLLSREKLQGGLIAAVSSGRLARGSNTYRNLTQAAALVVQADSMATTNPGAARAKLAEATALFRREEEVCLGSKRFTADGSMDPYCTSFGMEAFATLFRKEVLRISSVIGSAPPAARGRVFAVDWGDSTSPARGSSRAASIQAMPEWVPYVLGALAVGAFWMGLRPRRKR